MKILFRLATPLPRFFAVFCLLGAVALLPLVGCKKGTHTSDPRLRQIDEMLDSQLPTGTPKARVGLYLSSQGFPIQDSSNSQDIVAIVHHVDTETLQPATARVTFHFDANGNLKSYELVSAAGSLQQQ